jgi:cysteine-rich repeat protein
VTVTRRSKTDYSQAANTVAAQQNLCGNARLDFGELCDDGNVLNGDGCSGSCRVESGWTCAAPVGLEGIIGDGGLELGTPNPYWTESSTNFDSPICNELDCGLGTGSGPASGDWWAWFGGIEVAESSSLLQTIEIPDGARELTFRLELSACDSASDFLEVRIAGNQRWRIDGSNELCGLQGYTEQTVNISQFADGGLYNLEFRSRTFGNNEDVTNFFVDDIALKDIPSVCTRLDPSIVILRDGFEAQ